jgi:hypothetical protein
MKPWPSGWWIAASPHPLCAGLVGDYPDHSNSNQNHHGVVKMNEEQTKLVEGLCAQCLGWRERARDGVALPTNEALDAPILAGEVPFFRVNMDDDAVEDCVRRDNHINLIAAKDAAITALRAEVARLTYAPTYADGVRDALREAITKQSEGSRK